MDLTDTGKLTYGNIPNSAGTIVLAFIARFQNFEGSYSIYIEMNYTI